MLFKSLLWTFFTISTAIKVPSSWKDEQTFLPYYVVVDGLPSAQNVETYYPESAASDQVVQNDVVVKLFQKMNPHLPILKPQPLEDPPKLSQKPILIDESLTHNEAASNQQKIKQEQKGEKQDDEVKKPNVENVNHEDPGDIPTKPIYPGEGQWARKGLKHQPHITKNIYDALPKHAEPPTPGTDFYNAQKIQFQKDFDEFPRKKKEDVQETASSEDFEPYRTYAQVRKTITKKRLPKKKKTDPRLRESIKDSKIHTVYSEEGYEDSAYDHGDQEKQAERHEKAKGVDQDEDKDFDFPEEPPPPSEDEENLESDDEAKPKDEKQSESKSQAVVEFDSQKTQPKQAAIDQEEHLIDSIMDESKYGKRIIKKKPQSNFIIRVRRRRSTDDVKYPHYASTKVNSLSSLRYTENSDSMPKGSMSFYKEADKKECPEVTDVDPVPQKVKDATNHTDDDHNNNSSITTPNPKLDKLGDQIDCFKTRYFGEDPLDNPLFKEETIDTPNSSFLNNGGDEENYIDYQEEEEYFDQRQNRNLNENITDESLPEAQPYILVKRIYRRPQRKKAKRTKTRFPPPNKFDQYPASTNSERISEVHYKDEIKPSEQMNVFSDVINNIKNSSRDSGLESSEIQPVTIRVSQKYPPRRNPPPKKRIRTTTNQPPVIAEIYEDFGQIHHRLRPTTSPPYSNEIPTRGYKKRKRRPTQVATEVLELTTEYVKVKKRRIKPDYTTVQTENQDLELPPIMNGFKPIIIQDEIIQTNHKPEYQEIETATTNKFLVVGMRPPPEVPYVHPNYYLNHQIKLKRRNQIPSISRKRYVRSAGRRGYADIQRDLRVGPTTTSKVTVQEEDDYIPHRSRNFHYDEKTGKIVYDKKPEDDISNQQQEEIEYEYVEIEEPTHPPVGKKKVEPRRVWPSKFADGPNYLDFIKKLKENPNYVQILDPKPTEKSVETTTVQNAKTIARDKDAIPEFLAILTKVKSDKNYEVIQDTTQKPKSTPPTTASIPKEIEDEIEDVQNSPGAQSSDLIKSSDDLGGSDSDSASKSKNYNPKTGVDTSKYTSIQRPLNTRHSISSRYKSEAADLDQVETGELESVPTTITESFTINIPTTSIPPTTPFKMATTSTTTVKTRRIVPNRRRGTTTPSTTSTTEATTQIRRLNRGRNRFRSTTTEASREESTRSRRNLSRRSQVNLTVPKNHKEHYAEAQTVSSTRDVKPTPRSISLELLKQSDNNRTKLDDVEVFKDYDKDKKHGGNYKYKKVQIKITRNYNPSSSSPPSALAQNDENPAQYYDIVPKPFTYYSDTKLPLKINDLKEKSDDMDVTVFEEDNNRRVSSEEDVNFGESQELGSQITNHDIPAFIKDPSKRLYYYAPL